MKFNAIVCQSLITLMIGVICVISGLCETSVAFRLVIILCGVISITGLCIVKAITEISGK